MSPEKEMSRGDLVPVSSHSAEGAVRDRGSAQEALGRQELVRRVKPPLPLFKVSHSSCHRKPDVPTRDRLTLHIEIKPGRPVRHLSVWGHDSLRSFLSWRGRCGCRLLHALLCSPQGCVSLACNVSTWIGASQPAHSI